MAPWISPVQKPGTDGSGAAPCVAQAVSNNTIPAAISGKRQLRFTITSSRVSENDQNAVLSTVRHFLIDLIKLPLNYENMDSFTALADPTRRKIVEHLASAPLAAGDIAARFPLSKPAISQHLNALKAAHLVTVEVRGQQRIYRLNKAGLDEMDDWIARTRRHWTQALDTLETLLMTENPDEPE